MNKFLLALAAIFMFNMANAQNKMDITVNGRTMTATLADTEAARQLNARLAEGPVTVSMNDYGGFEKVGDLPWSLPASNSQITTAPGDIMLYQGRSIVIFYGLNSWAYTPLGRIDGASASEIRDFLGNGSIELTLTSTTSTGIREISDPDTPHSPLSGKNTTVVTLTGRVINLNGRKLSDLPKGVYIINGKKQIIK